MLLMRVFANVWPREREAASSANGLDGDGAFVWSIIDPN